MKINNENKNYNIYIYRVLKYYLLLLLLYMAEYGELDDNLKKSIADFCRSVYPLIKKDNSRISSIIIQYNDENIYIGYNPKGRFTAKYYDSNKEIDNELYNLVADKSHCIVRCKNKIDEVHGNTLKSYNIFYHPNEGVINVCRNMLGHKGIYSCRWFNEFNDDI